jgi:hypothetical protein
MKLERNGSVGFSPFFNTARYPAQRRSSTRFCVISFVRCLTHRLAELLVACGSTQHAVNSPDIGSICQQHSSGVCKRGILRVSMAGEIWPITDAREEIAPVVRTRLPLRRPERPGRRLCGVP